jgi:hypothetical protein
MERLNSDMVPVVWIVKQCELVDGLKMTVFWDVAPCSLAETDRHFRGVYCIHHQGDDGGSRHQ